MNSHRNTSTSRPPPSRASAGDRSGKGCPVRVDLSGVTFVDSMALGVLLGSMKRLRVHGGKLLLVAPATDIRRIFEITLLDRVFALFPTREEALSIGA